MGAKMSDERLSEMIPFRCTPTQRWEWEEVARLAEMTFSQFLREAADQLAEKVRDEKKKGARR